VLPSVQNVLLCLKSLVVLARFGAQVKCSGRRKKKCQYANRGVTEKQKSKEKKEL